MKNRIALVTGAGRGIGRGIALKLAEAGYDVGVHYGTSREGAEQVAEAIRKMGRKAVTIQGNVQNVQEIEEMFKQFFKEFDRIDVLVNNAGITRMAPFLEISEELWNSVVNTDLKGAFFCAQQAARKMVETGSGGVIINITSNHSIGCWPNSTVYGPVKAALDKLTKNMALDLAKYGIRVVAIAPGYTHLEWFPERSRPYIEQISKRIPMQRFCTPEEVGAAVVYLASDEAGYITGTTLFMDGGALLPVVADNEYC
ncbi:MAG: SDR family oxidoreductase [Clostridiales bacterium]|jgi:NAD(P)-dependent dehydrogenase (short-subunit alcohol dehydrogenase family)|nr:SDR family oxidoreductase [Clostridiales bacterium]